MSAHPTSLLPMTVVDLPHPSERAALTGPAWFIKVGTYRAVSWKRLSSIKTTVKDAVPDKRKERADPADEKAWGAVTAQSSAVVIRPQGIGSKGANQCTQNTTTACVIDQ